MPQGLWNPETVVVAGVLLALTIAILALLQPRVRTYIRRATWLGVLGWWLVVALVWTPLLLGPGFGFGGPAWLWIPLGFVLGILLHILIVGTPLFAIGATVIWPFCC